MSVKIVIASGKGGVGKSSAAVGIGHALKKLDKKVLLVDCDLSLGGLDIMLDVAKDIVFNWGDVLAGRCETENAIIDADGISFLAVPDVDENEISADAFNSLFAQLDSDFDYIIFDSPAGIAEGFTLCAGAADRAIIVATPDNVCVRSGARAADRLRATGIEDIRLIINRFEVKPVRKHRLLNIDECIDAASLQLIGIVPEDNAITYSTVTGITPDRSPAARAFARIARRIDGERLPLVIE